MAKEGAYAVLYILLLKFQEMLDAYTNFPLLVQLARKISVYFVLHFSRTHISRIALDLV